MIQELEARCFCSREPLLAVCGRDAKTHEPFIHIKSWKGKKLIVEAVITSGTVRIRCRECLRWHRLTIVEVSVDAVPEPLPENLRVALSG